MPWLTPALPAFSPATHPYLTIRPLAPLEACLLYTSRCV